MSEIPQVPFQKTLVETQQVSDASHLVCVFPQYCWVLEHNAAHALVSRSALTNTQCLFCFIFFSDCANACAVALWTMVVPPGDGHTVWISVMLELSVFHWLTNVSRTWWKRSPANWTISIRPFSLTAPPALCFSPESLELSTWKSCQSNADTDITAVTADSSTFAQSSGCFEESHTDRHRAEES